MTRLEDLTLNLADEALSELESRELDLLLRAEPDQDVCLELLRIEAALRGSRQNFDLAPAIMAHLRTQRENAVADRIMSGIKDSPRPLWQRDRRNTLGERVGRLRGLVAGVLSLRPIYVSLAAACGAVMVVVLIWLFGANVGRPVLAQVSGEGLLLERGGQSVRATAGMALEAGDVVRTGPTATAVIGFAPEKTSVTIQQGSDFRLASTSAPKTFDLRLGKLEGSVARQRPFCPMVLKTPQAEVRVLGTKFTLTVATNSTRLEVAEGKVRFTRLADLQHVQVSSGHYAVCGVNYDLASLPTTGWILREFWNDVAGTNLYEIEKEARFRKRPDAWDLVPALKLAPVETNRLVVRFRGYLHPPVTGDYEFWLVGASKAKLFMSPSERAEDAITIAQIFASQTNWDAPRMRGSSNWSPPSPLVAGRLYYIEALLLVEHGEGRLSVAWKGPGRKRELLTGEFLSPAKPKE